MPHFLMIEDDEEFWCYSTNPSEARQHAAAHNALLVRQATRKEEKYLCINDIFAED